MKAIRFHSFGGVDVLRYEDVPKPTISPTEVLIQLKAAALNHPDIWVRSGARERKIPLPIWSIKEEAEASIQSVLRGGR